MAGKSGKSKIQGQRREKRKILLSGYVPVSVRKRSACRALERICDLRCLEPLQITAGILYCTSDGMGRIRSSG